MGEQSGFAAAMASFVTEVLAHSGKLEKEDLGTQIGRLTRQVEEVKVRAQQGETCWGAKLGLGRGASPGRDLGGRGILGGCGEVG